VLEIRSIAKTFPGVVALSGVSVDIRPGEIHALLGENGAGKSTLMRILCGILQPDSGRMSLDGRPLVLEDYHAAIRNRISTVHQEIQVVPLASVAENIMLDKLARFRRGPFLAWGRLEAEARRYMELVGLSMSPRTQAGVLSAAQKQLASIARALSSGARVLLLDEPTSSLTLHEAATLFALLRRLKDEGVAIVFVSHKLEEVLELCDVVTVLRDGRLIGTRPRRELDRNAIVEMMIGRAMVDRHRGLLPVRQGGPVLEVLGLRSEFFDGLDLVLHPGEILGLYGLVGSGRSELARTLIGEYPHTGGEIRVKGEPARIDSVHDALHRYGIGYVSENRKEDGLILSASVTTNIAITIWPKLARLVPGFFSPRRELERSRDMIERLEIRTPSPEQRVVNLSGGNQQKVSIAKWLVAGCDILIIDEPTVGVDVGAKAYIHELIWRMASEEGKSVILISSDMPEMISLARRIVVFKQFRIVAELSDLNAREQANEEIGRRIGAVLA
jgi:ribose transport system ATP-binding protein